MQISCLGDSFAFLYLCVISLCVDLFWIIQKIFATIHTYWLWRHSSLVLWGFYVAGICRTEWRGFMSYSSSCRSAYAGWTINVSWAGVNRVYYKSNSASRRFTKLWKQNVSVVINSGSFLPSTVLPNSSRIIQYFSLSSWYHHTPLNLISANVLCALLQNPIVHDGDEWFMRHFVFAMSDMRKVKGSWGEPPSYFFFSVIYENVFFREREPWMRADEVGATNGCGSCRVHLVASVKNLDLLTHK